MTNASASVSHLIRSRIWSISLMRSNRLRTSGSKKTGLARSLTGLTAPSSLIENAREEAPNDAPRGSRTSGIPLFGRGFRYLSQQRQRVHHLIDGKYRPERAVAIQCVKAPVCVHDDIDRDLRFIVAHAHWLGPSSQAPGGGQQAQGGAAAVAPL